MFYADYDEQGVPAVFQKTEDSMVVLVTTLPDSPTLETAQFVARVMNTGEEGQCR
jgi:hypothetical protein